MSHFSLSQKTAVITGAGKGIGKSIAQLFARQGAEVHILDLDPDAGSEAVDEITGAGGRAWFHETNVADQQAVLKVFDKIYERNSRLDVLVNNAGILQYSSVTETSEESWDSIMDVNLKGAFLCAKYGIPEMLKNNSGVVVNMSSVQAYVAQQKVAAYVTSKSALIGLTQSIAVDYAPQIRSVAICPGGIDTPLNREAFQQSADPEKARRETIVIIIQLNLFN